MRRTPATLAGLILGLAILVGLTMGAASRSPTLTASPDPAVRGESITLTGSGFNGHPVVLLQFSDGQPSVTVKPSGGRFTWSEVVPLTTPDQWTITALDGRTLTALAYAVPA